MPLYCCCLLLLWWKLIAWMLHELCPSEICPIEFPGDSNSSEKEGMTTNMRTLHKNTPNFHNSWSVRGWSSLLVCCLKGFLGNSHQLYLWKTGKTVTLRNWNTISPLILKENEYYWMDTLFKCLLFSFSQSNLKKNVINNEHVFASFCFYFSICWFWFWLFFIALIH